MKPIFSQVLAMFVFQHALGWGYNALIGWMERNGWLEGYVSDAVALGVGVTLVVQSAFLLQWTLSGWLWGLATLGSFACTGIPMMVGSRVRYARARAQEQADVRQTATVA